VDVRRRYAGDEQAHGHDADPGQDLEPHRSAVARAKPLAARPGKGDPASKNRETFLPPSTV